MSTETRNFDLGDVLAVTTGRWLLSPTFPQGILDILGFLTGEVFCLDDLCVPKVMAAAQTGKILLNGVFPFLALADERALTKIPYVKSVSPGKAKETLQASLAMWLNKEKKRLGVATVTLTPWMRGVLSSQGPDKQATVPLPPAP